MCHHSFGEIQWWNSFRRKLLKTILTYCSFFSCKCKKLRHFWRKCFISILFFSFCVLLSFFFTYVHRVGLSKVMYENVHKLIHKQLLNKGLKGLSVLLYLIPEEKNGVSGKGKWSGKTWDLEDNLFYFIGSSLNTSKSVLVT